MPDVDAIWGWVVAVITVSISAIVSLFPKRGSLAHQMIDQLQERVTSLETNSAAQSARIDFLEDSLIWYRRRDVAWERREAQLMSGVERGEYPPWPERTGILAEERHD